MLSLSLKNFSITQVESSTIKLGEKIKTMTLPSLDGVNKMEPNIGSLETRGDLTGVKEEISGSSEESIILVFKALAHGPHQSILGPKMSEMKPSPVQHKLSQNSI